MTLTLNIITIILFASILILWGISLYLVGRKGVSEEEELVVPRLVSPAYKIIKIMFYNIIRSIELALIIISLLLTSFSIAYASTYLYSSSEIDASSIPYTYDILMISNSYEQGAEYVKEVPVESIKIVQIYNGVLIEQDNKSIYLLPLVINCSPHVKIYVGDIDKICKLVSQGNTAIIDNKKAIGLNTISIDGQRFFVVKEDLSNFVRVEILPSIYLVHSLGAIGGTPLVATPTDIIILPENEKVVEALCNTDCNAKTIFLARNSSYVDIARLLKHFDLVAVRTNGKIHIYSPNLVPSSRTFIGLALSALFSLVFSITVSGGLAERIKLISQRLALSGVTYGMLSSSLAIVMIAILLVFYIPLLIVASLSGVENIFGVASTSYLLSATISIMVIVYRASAGLKVRGSKVLPKPSIVLNHTAKINVNMFRNELEKDFSLDDFFMLSEFEVLEDTNNMVEMRIELIYKKGLSSIVNIEIYGEKINGLWNYNLLADVWSLEELSGHEQAKLVLMALSKIQGVFTKCITE